MTARPPTPPWSDDDGAAIASELFRATFDAEPQGVWAAPGRVNLIGEHLDYNGGPCLPIALPHRTFAAVTRRGDDVVRVVSGFRPQETWVGRVADIAPGRVNDWIAYAAGPAWALAEDGFEVGGFDVALESCVPVGAGLSSSAAVECAVAIALDELHAWGQLDLGDRGRTRLATACVRAENEVAGAPTGGMDQAISLRGQDGHALLLESRDGSARQVPLDLSAAGLELLVIDTRASHALVDGQYAARRRACQSAAAHLGVEHLADLDDLGTALVVLSDEEEQRLVRHVVSETARVRALVALVAEGREREAGDLLSGSHRSLRDDYRVSCAELDVAVESALAAGALGARMTGGGFGGSAIALIESGHAARVAARVTTTFADQGWAEPEFHTATASSGAARVA